MGPRTGELVVQRGLATVDQVARALDEAAARREPLCSRLLAAGVPEGPLAAVLSEKHGVPGVDLSRCAIALDVLALVPRAVAEADLILPLSGDGGRLHLAMSRPGDERVIAEVRFVTGREVSPYVAVKASLARAIHEAYEAHASGLLVWCGAEAGDAGPVLAAVQPLEGGEVLEILDDDVVAGAGDEPLESPPDAALDAGIEIEIAPEPPPRPGGKRLVLVVDDEPEIRQLVARTLEAKGYAVAVAADGAEAVAQADALVPDLVLLDAMLPKLHGFEACRRLKSSPRTRQVPVVMMTAIYRGWRFAQDAREAYGAEDYVEKPFRLDDLLRRVEAAIDATSSRPAQPPDPAGPQLARARDLLASGRPADAAEVAAAAARRSPYSAEAQLLLGRALLARGDRFGAMTALERAAELRPGHFAGLRALAALYEETGFRRKATGVLERALPAAPDEGARAAVRRDLLRLLA